MAMGAGRATVLRMLLVQVLMVAGLGYGIGVGGACLTGLAFGGAGLAFRMNWTITLAGGASVLLCCLAAGFLGGLSRVALGAGDGLQVMRREERSATKARRHRRRLQVQIKFTLLPRRSSP